MVPIFKKIKGDVKRYGPYIRYASKCELKSEVASSYLNWLWWILDPLFFMLVYLFIAVVVFDRPEPYFPVFVFVGLTMWNFFSKCVTNSILLIKKNKTILANVYLPKYMLVLQTMTVNGIKMFISWSLVIVFAIFYQVPINFTVLMFIPIIISFFIFCFGINTILLNLGIFISDLSHVITVLLRLMMYLSGIFYSIEGLVPHPFNEILLYLNPAAFYIHATRESILYQTLPNLVVLGAWTVVGIALSVFGLRLVSKHENTYAKVS